MASPSTPSGPKSVAKTPSKLGKSWVYTPRPQKVSDGNIFSSSAKKPDSAFTERLKGVTIESPKQVSETVSPAKLVDIKPEAYGSAQAEQALADANLDLNYLRAIQKDLWESIAPVSKPRQHLIVYATLLTMKNLIYQAELDSSLLLMLDEVNDDPEDEEDVTIVSTPTKKPKPTSQTKKTSKATTKGQKSDKDKMQIDAEARQLRKSTRDKTKAAAATGTGKKLRSIMKSRVANVQLEPVRLSLSSKIDVADTEGLRDRFIHVLRKTEITIKKNKNDIKVRLDDDAQKLVVNAFFAEFMSSKALANVKAIIASSNKSFAHNQQAHHAIHARKVAAKLPPVLKEFANNLALSIELQTLTGAYKVFQQYLADCNMYDSYQNAVLALHEDPQLQHFFVSKGYDTSRGRDWRSVLKDYFCQHVYKTSAKNWDNTVHQIAPVWHLVRYFGRGILLLLREEHKSRFVNIGVGTVNAIAPIVAAIAPDFVWAVSILGETVYLPLVKGEHKKLPKTQLVERSGSFLANIQGCFDPDHRVERPAEFELPVVESSDDEDGDEEEDDDDEDTGNGSDESDPASDMDTD